MDERLTNELVHDALQVYGRYVLEDRALPDVRDGLKPVQRRLLYCLHRLKATAKAIPVKASKVVGDTTGDFHPHGDASTYGALVQLSQIRYRLVDPEGNFGDRTGLREHSPAAMRYPECRMSALAERMFGDIGIVTMVDNYNATDTEPVVLPAPLPLALINGASGIAVGLSTCLPPHNLGEVIRALVLMIDQPDVDVPELMEVLPGPDYGVGALLSDQSEVAELYRTGKGSLRYRSDYHVEDLPRGRKKLVITGLAPDVKKTKLLSLAQDLYDKKLIDSPVMSESTLEEGYRDTIEYRDPGVVRDRILPLLNTTVTYNQYCIAQDGSVERFGLVALMRRFLRFRAVVERKVLLQRRTAIQDKLESEQTKLLASQNLNAIVKISRYRKESTAKIKLQKLLGCTEKQADQILKLSVRTLLAFSRPAIQTKIADLQQDLSAIVDDLNDLPGVIKRRLLSLQDLGDARGTKLQVRKTKKLGESQQYWVAVTSDGQLYCNTKLPVDSRAAWTYCGLVRSDDFVVVVHETGLASIVLTSYADQYEPAGRVVGIAAGDQCLVVTASGRYCCFPTDQRRQTFQTIKDLGDDEIVAVVGLDEDTVVQFDVGKTKWPARSTFRVTRPNVKGRSLRSLENVRAAAAVPDGVRRQLGHFVGPQNLVVLQDNRRMIKSRADALQLVRDQQAALVLPLPEGA